MNKRAAVYLLFTFLFCVFLHIPARSDLVRAQASFEPVSKPIVREEVINHVYVPCAKLVNQRTVNAKANHAAYRKAAIDAFKENIDGLTQFIFLESMKRDMSLSARKIVYAISKKQCETFVLEHTQ